MTILFAALVCIHVLIPSEKRTQFFTCSTLHCHWRVKLMPFNTLSSSTRLGVISRQSYSGHLRTGNNSHVQLPAIHLPIPTGWIISLHRIHTLPQLSYAGGWCPCFIVLTFHDWTHSHLRYSTSHMKPTTHWEAPNKSPTQGEHCPLLDNIRRI